MESLKCPNGLCYLSGARLNGFDCLLEEEFATRTSSLATLQRTGEARHLLYSDSLRYSDFEHADGAVDGFL